MEKIVITAGDSFTDIDILASAISYSELLFYEGKNNEVVLKGAFNKSITDEVKNWKFTYKKTPTIKNCSFVIVDISQPEHVAKFVNQSKIIEFYDHHFGFEKYWQENVHGKVKIEGVGACATLIFEEFLKRKIPLKISKTSANLLSAAIVSNTLNFKAAITSSRDIEAFNTLKEFSDMTENWIKKYFSDQEELVFLNPVKEIINDTQVETFPGTDDKLIIGQIELWNSKDFVFNHTKEIEKALSSFKYPDWFLTSPSISEGKNYIYTLSDKVKKLLSVNLKISFYHNIATTERLLLRKEIKKILYKF